MNFCKFLKIFLVFFCLGLGSQGALAQEEKLSLTITPPLIKINISPGDVWSSSVKVVNNNPENLKIYTLVMDFRTKKEGEIEFIHKKDIKKGQSFLLSQWIEISQDPILIPAYQSKEVPFTIKVPLDAEPGGHYAAILAGTRPLEEEVKGTGIRISSLVSCLILANVLGEVIEEARIREFSTDQVFYQKPEVKFTVRVENTGNVHIQPQGEIRIYNFWGKERGVIAINQKTDFGNVLPKSIRKWVFTWQGEKSPLEAGRYKAVLVLSFGSKAKQTVSALVYFWVLPLKPTLGILGGIFLFFAFSFLMIRAYIKRAILVAQKETQIIAKLEPQIVVKPSKKEVAKKKRIIFKHLIKKYYRPFLIILMFVLSGVALSFYFKDVLKSTKSYKIIIEKEGKAEIIIPQIKKPKIELSPSAPKTKSSLSPKPLDKTGFTISVLNGSGRPGVATKTANWLKKEGFKITKIANADNFNYQKTIILYKTGKRQEAEFLNQFFKRKADLIEIETQLEDLVIIIGKDYAK